MAIPLAVAPSVRSPGLALAINLLAAASSPGLAKKRILILASKNTTGGTITADTQLAQGVGADDVKTYAGSGSPAHLCAKRLFEEYGLASVDYAAPAEPAGTAGTVTITFDASAPVTVAQLVTMEICGRTITVNWPAGGAAIAQASAAVSAILAYDADLPMIPSNAGGAAAVLTLTFKQKGTLGNDAIVAATMSGGTGGSIALSAASPVNGASEADFATVLTLVSGQEYDYIIPITGNTDACSASATSNVGKTKTKVDSLNSGFTAKLQQIIVATTGALSATKTGTGQHDYGPLAYTFCNAGRSLPCEWAGAEAGARTRDVTLDAAANRINTPYSKAQLFGPKDLVANSLTAVQVEDALQSGVTPVTYTFQGVPRPARPITSYFKDTAGNPDGRILDQSNVDGIYTVAKDLRVALPQEFPNAKLVKDQIPGADPIPDGVVEEKDIKSFCITRLRFWQNRGVVRKDKLDEAIANGTLIAMVDPTDESQADIVIPIAIVKPLAKFSLCFAKVA